MIIAIGILLIAIAASTIGTKTPEAIPLYFDTDMTMQGAETHDQSNYDPGGEPAEPGGATNAEDIDLAEYDPVKIKGEKNNSASIADDIYNSIGD